MKHIVNNYNSKFKGDIMDFLEIKEKLEKECMNKHSKKMFTLDELKAICFVMNDLNFSITKVASFFKVDFNRFKKIINLLKEKELKSNKDYEEILNIIN